MIGYFYRDAYRWGVSWHPTMSDLPIPADDQPDVIIDPKTGEVHCGRCQGRLYMATNSHTVRHTQSESVACPGTVEELQERAGG